MKIKVNTIGSQIESEISLTRERIAPPGGGEPHLIWKYAQGDISIAVQENLDGSVARVEKSDLIETESESIIAQFIEQKQQLIETESSGIEYDEIADSLSRIEPQPYDPELIRVDPRPFSLKQTFELIMEGDIDLSPDFQRHFVWKEIEKRSRLIESIMLRIPLPVFYLSQDGEGKFQVVDGLQRLTVIKQFLNNEFKLKNLEYLKDCEGRYFDKVNKLEAKYVRRITQAQLIMNIIDPQTPVRVKFEIFKRLNQGGKPLKPQEIRNCMASVTIRKFINELADSDAFKRATDYSVNPMRMEDQELILRFVGFYYVEYLKKGSFKYTGNMETFLDDTLDILNHESTSVLGNITKSFTNAMNNAHHVFGNYAFRKCIKAHFNLGARRQFINKSLFTSWSVLLAQFDSAKITNELPTNVLNIPLAEEIEKYSAFYDAITNGTNDQNRMTISFETARNIIGQFIK